MKNLFFLLLTLSALTGKAQKSPATTAASDTLIVDAACGECRLGLKGKSCDLAIRMNGKAYFVDGTAIDDHGDAHAKDGFCNAIRKAKVVGEVVDGRFKASYFKLVNAPVKKGTKK